MANRVLRDWTTSEKIDILSPHAELFFVRLIMKADDHGCFHANEKLLKAALFPLRDVMTNEIDKWLQECVRAGIIKTYEAEGRKYLQILNFGQRLRTMNSKFPMPDSNSRTNVSNEQPETKRNEVETETRNECMFLSFEEKFKNAFDDLTLETYQMTFRERNIKTELQEFLTKCNSAKDDYHQRDISGLRLAFQYQLKNSRNGTGNKKGVDVNAALDHINRHIQGG